MEDIARQARVSRATAAKVLFNTGGSNTRVSKATAERVRRIAEKLDYRPHVAAQQLAGKPTRLIGVILDAKAPNQFTRTLVDIEQIAAARNFLLLVGYVNDSLDQIAEYAKEFRGREVEGVICLSHNYPEFGQHVPALFRGIPNTVFVRKPLGGESVPYVTPDFERVGYLGTKHLLDHGRRRIVVLRSQSRYEGMLDWEAGCQRAVEESGLPSVRSFIWRGPSLRINRRRLVDHCLDEVLPLKPDALFPSNDESAVWIIRGLYERGIRVPQDIAVVSGSRQPFGLGAIPAITSIDQRERAVAKRAAKMVFEMIEGATPAVRESPGILVKPRLVVAESCGARKKASIQQAKPRKA
ncbi:MAG TPA: LacI family DNA-binding transcriptional regulator [Phycisphaeraceae bacterium]